MAHDRVTASGNLPRHVAIIMDGNGRWAQARGRPRTEGHAAGARAVRSAVRAARERGLAALTLFALSTENLHRPRDEVRGLMRLLVTFMRDEAAELIANGIRFVLMGDSLRLPPVVTRAARGLERVTARCTEMTLTVAVAYGGREDLVAAAGLLASDGGPVTPARLAQRLWSAHLPPVDLLIRTGGERRISNFVLWHLAYAELYFTDLRWPDFDAAQLDRALAEYGARSRRFGLVG